MAHGRMAAGESAAPQAILGRTASWCAAAAVLGTLGCNGASTSSPAPGSPAPASATATPSTPATASPGGQVFVRREINQASTDSAFVAAYRTGVKAMMARQATDPTSWTYQANIHGFPTSTDPSGQVCTVTPGSPQPAWETCQHGSFFFLSWHRMYLYYFERILRQASGDPNFALPFWNYGPSNQRALPQIFRTPTLPDGSANSLFVQQRAPGINAGTRTLSNSEVSDATALTRIPFLSQQPPANLSFGGLAVSQPQHLAGGGGQLELQPHNVIHVALGGNTGWMSWVECAGRDPIFWLHHANIDRLWQVWLNQGGGRSNPTGNATWTTQTNFTFFNENGQAVTLTGAQVLNTAAQLQYRYEGVPVQGEPGGPPAAPVGAAPPPSPTPEPPMRRLAATPDADVTLGPKAARVTVEVPAAEGKRLGAAARSAAPMAPLMLVVEGLQQDHPGAYFAVYLNLPAGTKPDPAGPHFVGNIALFGSHAGGEGTQVAFDVTEAVRQLHAKNKWTGKLDLTFVKGGPPAPAGAAPGPDVYLRFKRVSLLER